MTDIWKAAFAGDLKTVQEILGPNPALLDSPFQATYYPELIVPLAALATLAKKTTSAFFAVFAVACAATIAPATAGASLFLLGSSTTAAMGTWSMGDIDLAFYRNNLENFTPLDCAALGYSYGVADALSVALYLIDQGASGRYSHTADPSKKLFEYLGNQTFNQACKTAFMQRQLTITLAQRNDQLRERNQLDVQKQAFDARAREIQLRQVATLEHIKRLEAERDGLHKRLQERDEAIAPLQAKLQQVEERLSGIRVIACKPDGTRILVQTPPSSQAPASVPAHLEALKQAPQSSLPSAFSVENIVQRLARKHLVLHRVAGDGNCFFRAVADQLNCFGMKTQQGEDYTHEILRALVMGLVGTKPDLRAFYTDADLIDLSKLGGWVGHQTAAALADILNVRFNIVRERENDEVLIAPIRPAGFFQGNPLPILNLYFNNAREHLEHYDSLRPMPVSGEPERAFCLQGVK